VASTFIHANAKEEKQKKERKKKTCKGSEERPQVADAYAVSFGATGLMYAM
jgi:hypothetical protein